MSRSTVARPEAALGNLRTLLEVNAQMARERLADRVAGHPSDAVQDALALATRSASHHRDELADVIREWESHAHGGRAEATPSAEARLTPRELLESWLAIKESAAEMLNRAAGLAPSARLRRRLLDLAHEESVHAARLRDLI